MSTHKPRAQLLLPLRNRAAFLDAYFSKSVDEDRPGGLFISGEIDVELGEEADVEIAFAEEQVRFHIRAVVKWRRALLGRRSIPPGVGIEFLASEQRTQQQILRFAEGKESVTHKDRERRYSMSVDVTLELPGKEITGTTDDMSEGGCFVITDADLPIGAQVDVRLRPPGALFGWLTLPAFVQWTRQQEGRAGIGLAFRFDGERQRDKVKKIVHVLKQRMLRDVQVKVPRVTTPPSPTEE